MSCCCGSKGCCNTCNNFTLSQSLTANATNSTLTINTNLTSIDNNEQVCICIAQNIPDGVTSQYQVLININGTNYNFIDSNGHYVYGDQICSRKVYCMRYAADSRLFIYNGCCKLKRSAHVIAPETTPAV